MKNNEYDDDKSQKETEWELRFWFLMRDVGFKYTSEKKVDTHCLNNTHDNSGLSKAIAV